MKWHLTSAVLSNFMAHTLCFACGFPAAMCEPCDPTPAQLLDLQQSSTRSDSRLGNPITQTITMANFSFSPATSIVPVGAAVQWSNIDANGHSTVSQTGMGTLIPSGVWQSPVFELGQSFTFVANVLPGTYHYFCEPHSGSMRGVLHIRRPADADGDNLVTLNDFTVLAANFGQTGQTFDRGNFNLDGFVNLDDFTILAANFGLPLTPSARAVPEPGAAVGIAVLAVLMSGNVRRHNRRS